LGDKVVQANFVQFNNDFSGLLVEFGMFLQCTFQGFCYRVSAHAWVKSFLYLPPQCKTQAFAFQFFGFWLGCLSDWAGLRYIGGCLGKIHFGSFFRSLLFKVYALI